MEIAWEALATRHGAEYRNKKPYPCGYCLQQVFEGIIQLSELPGVQISRSPILRLRLLPLVHPFTGAVLVERGGFLLLHVRARADTC